MFGGPAYMVNDNLFAGVCQDYIFLRLSEDDRGRLISAWQDAEPFEPMPGRPMKEYLVLPPGLYANETALHEWIQRSLGYASSLPAKPPKAKKR